MAWTMSYKSALGGYGYAKCMEGWYVGITDEKRPCACLLHGLQQIS